MNPMGNRSQAAGDWLIFTANRGVSTLTAPSRRKNWDSLRERLRERLRPADTYLSYNKFEEKKGRVPSWRAGQAAR
jgi:hypothetical protein